VITNRTARLRNLLHQFVLPDLEGSHSGGSVFNRGLLEALCTSGLGVTELSLAQAASVLHNPKPYYLWVDSLWLNELPRLRKLVRQHGSIGLLTHYLPSLVRYGAIPTRAQLSLEELLALDETDAFLVTSEFMQSAVGSLLLTPRPIIVVEPARTATKRASAIAPAIPLFAVMVANLLPGKGVEPFLRALGEQTVHTDQYQLEILGSHRMDPHYASACDQLVASQPTLSERVRFRHTSSPAEVIERISEANLLVSASTMESYGMVLAEARTIGVPILAHAGGNVENHVQERAGGEMVRSHAQLARAFLTLCRNTHSLTSRAEAAWQMALPTRSWLEAARDYIAQLPRLGSTAWVQDQ